MKLNNSVILASLLAMEMSEVWLIYYDQVEFADVILVVKRTWPPKKTRKGLSRY